MTIPKLGRLAREELTGTDPRAFLAQLLTAPLPAGAVPRLRTAVLRALGLAVGDRTLILSSIAVIGGPRAWRSLSIGADCFINQGCVFDATAPITLGDNIALGHGVLITTSSHHIGQDDRRAGLLDPAPVTVGSGAWLASRVVVLPGVHIGAGAVVSAGAVVTRSVEPNTMVGGVPAREIRRLDAGTASERAALLP